MVSHQQQRWRRKGVLQKRRVEAGKRNRLVRTILLGTVAVGLSLIWVARELELDRDALLGYLANSAVFVAILIACSLLGAVLAWLIRRLR
jgi:energy-converting hydrogenase Eha subunit E